MALPVFAPQHAPKKCLFVCCKRKTRFSCDRCARPVCGQHSKQTKDDGSRICGTCRTAPRRDH